MTTPTDAGSAELVARLRRILMHPYLENGNVMERPAPINPDGSEAADRILALETRIRELEGKYESVMAGTWFYPDGDTDTDSCYLDPAEVLDERYFDWHGVRSGVFPIERALRLPNIYAAVRAYSEAEKNARDSDDEYSVTWHLSEEEARAALKAQEPNP